MEPLFSPKGSKGRNTAAGSKRPIEFNADLNVPVFMYKKVLKQVPEVTKQVAFKTAPSEKFPARETPQ